ncbi:PorV/PorQ family protein [bacterium]|nr:PorV/PorQ family protein [bacterium]
MDSYWTRKTLLGILTGLCILLTVVVPNRMEAAGQAAAYLREGVGARALGMGNAGTAVSQDASAAYWNPASLAFMPLPASFVAQTVILGWERSWSYLSIAYSDFTTGDEKFSYAASWISFSAGGDLEARAVNRPEPDHIFRDSQNMISFSVSAGSLRDLFSLGLNVKMIFHSLDTESANGFGFDLGLWNEIAVGTQWGVVWQDVYTTLGWEDWHADRVPAYVRLGAAQYFLDKQLLLTGDLGLEFFHAAGAFRDMRVHLGLEYFLMPALALRAGWDTDRWTTGVGWEFYIQKAAWVHLDYALAGERLSDEGITQFISLTVNF